MLAGAGLPGTDAEPEADLPGSSIAWMLPCQLSLIDWFRQSVDTLRALAVKAKGEARCLFVCIDSARGFRAQNVWGDR